MNYQTIEEYFTQFPDDAEIISVNFNSGYLPDLSRFYKLKRLFCINNILTRLPPLPSTLEALNCNNNQLTSLPTLPSTLKVLLCNNNKLKYLLSLPSKLRVLYCYNNQLTHLPPLPYNMFMFKCYNNPFLNDYIKTENYMILSDYLTPLRKQINIINKFRELFYTLKYKKQFQYLLWVRIREPKIRNKYHPSNLITMLEGKEESTLDELDELLEKW